MVKEASDNAEEDKKRKAVIEAKNQADSVIHQTEKSLKEHGDSVGRRARRDRERRLPT